MSIKFLWYFTDFSTHVYCQAWNESKGCEELQLAHQKMKHEVVSQENHSREHARLESEAKAMEESVRTELQMTSSELASANKALQLAKQQHVGTQDRADLLERSCVQLRGEYQSSERLLAALQEEQQEQQRQLQKVATTASTGSADRAQFLAVEQRDSAALATF